MSLSRLDDAKWKVIEELKEDLRRELNEKREMRRLKQKERAGQSDR